MEEERSYDVHDPETPDSLYTHLREELDLRKQELVRCLAAEHVERLHNATSGIPAAELTTLGKCRWLLAQRSLTTARNSMSSIIPDPPKIPAAWSSPEQCLLYDVRRSERVDPTRSVLGGWVCDEDWRGRTLSWEEAASTPAFQFPKMQGVSLPVLFDTLGALQQAPYQPLDARSGSSGFKDPLLPSQGELFWDVHQATGFLDDPVTVSALYHHFVSPALSSSSLARGLCSSLEALSLEVP